MKIWTYLEQKTKIIGDCDLQDEEFVQTDEMIGYFNEAISEAEAEIHGIREEYFLKSSFIPVVVGQDTYPYPDDIYIRKIRRIVYSNGTIIYEVKKLKELSKFKDIALTTQFGPNDDYRHYSINPAPGQDAIVLLPKSRDTAILPQVLLGNSAPFTPQILWYMRCAQRVPIHNEYVKNWEQFILPQAITPTGPPGGNVIQLNQTGYANGDQVQFFPFAAPGGSAGLPAPLVPGVTYFVIPVGPQTPGLVQLASTAQQAATGISDIILTNTGSATGYFNVSIAATDAIIDSTIIDIPEFATFIMQWVKCRCFEKEGDPRLTAAVSTLEQQRAQMVGTLKEMVIDTDTEIEADFTHYQEMS